MDSVIVWWIAVAVQVSLRVVVSNQVDCCIIRCSIIIDYCISRWIIVEVLLYRSDSSEGLVSHIYCFIRRSIVT
jgi:hypothetical protein